MPARSVQSVRFHRLPLPSTAAPFHEWPERQVFRLPFREFQLSFSAVHWSIPELLPPFAASHPARLQSFRKKVHRVPDKQTAERVPLPHGQQTHLPAASFLQWCIRSCHGCEAEHQHKCHLHSEKFCSLAFQSPEHPAVSSDKAACHRVRSAAAAYPVLLHIFPAMQHRQYHPAKRWFLYKRPWPWNEWYSSGTYKNEVPLDCPVPWWRKKQAGLPADSENKCRWKVLSAASESLGRHSTDLSPVPVLLCRVPNAAWHSGKHRQYARRADNHSEFVPRKQHRPNPWILHYQL